jgi:antitoxin FitA
MTFITINIPDEQLQQLEHLAQESQVSAEELLRASIENWLASPKSEFSQAANYVLKKNAELYRRLA